MELSVGAGPDPDMTLANGEQISFYFSPASLCDLNRLILSRPACKHGYQGGKKNVVSVVDV